LRKLEEAGYLTIQKQFVNLRPQTTYTITDKGRDDFKAYINLLEHLIMGGTG
jgi:DNA-binding PadR family transcriptional regulator